MKQSAYEFWAAEACVMIVPEVRSSVLRLLSGNFGPFGPQQAVEVPLWLASSLKKRNLCTVVRPDWLTVEAMEATRAEEAERSDAFSALPMNSYGLETFLFETSRSNLDDGGSELDSMYRLHEDTVAIRTDKIRTGFLQIAKQCSNDEDTFSIKVNNVQLNEISRIRPLVTSAMRRFISFSDSYPRY